MSSHPFSRYKNRPTGYLLDDKDISGDRDQQRSDFLGETKYYSDHANKCDLMRDFLSKAINCEVKSVCMPKGSSKKDFLAFWDKELESKCDGDLIILYYDGQAGYNGENYAWQVFIPDSIPAYRLREPGTLRDIRRNQSMYSSCLRRSTSRRSIAC